MARERTLEKIRPHLQPGEQAQEVVAGTSRILPNFVVAVGFIVLVLIQFPAASKVRGSSWFFFAWVGLVLLLVTTSRRGVLVATDRRIVLFRVTIFGAVPTGMLLEGPRTEVTVTLRATSILPSAFPVQVETKRGAKEKLYLPQWLRRSAASIAEIARTPPPPPAPVLPS